MKTFIASENAQVIATTRFKNSIEFAVNTVANERQAITSRYDKSFIGSIVTFNPNNSNVNCFNLYANVNTSDIKEINHLLEMRLEKISNNEQFQDNQFITFINANEFEYYGFVGYVDSNEQAIRKMKVDNKFMSLYIDIVNSISEDNTPIEDMEFSMRTFNCLKRAGINTVQQIKNLSQNEVIKIRNLGMNSYNELQDKLNIKFV